jgi:hypothetical protein
MAPPNNVMKTYLGASGLTLALASALCPFPVGVVLSYFALLVAFSGAMVGDETFAIATTLWTALNVFVLSPLTLASLAAVADDSGANDPLGFWISIGLVLSLPILPLIFNGFRSFIHDE